MGKIIIAFLLGALFGAFVVVIWALMCAAAEEDRRNKNDRE